jgi:Effector-associated domain 1/CHAT domain
MAGVTAPLDAPVVLLAFANVDATRPLRNLAREGQRIRDVLDPLVARGQLAEVVVLWNATVDGIAAELRKERFKGRIRVLHFGGHADGSALMLANEHGAAARGHAAGLADLLGQQAGLELVVLNGCCTRAQVDRLEKRGMKAVVATSQQVMDDVAEDFAATLFAELVSKPLAAAFDAATAVVRGKKGEHPRELLIPKGGAESHEDWGDEPPWVLACKPEQREWRLVPARVEEEIDEDELVEQLATVIYDKGTAGVLLGRIGFPRTRVPDFSTSLVFWTSVVRELRSGALEGKERALIEAVAKMYPGNERFRGYRARYG